MLNYAKKVKFYKSLYLSNNSLLRNVFCMRLMFYNDSDNILETTDKTCSALEFINAKFCAYASS